MGIVPYMGLPTVTVDQRIGWHVTVYPEAREAAGRFFGTIDGWQRPGGGTAGESRDPERSAVVASSRARSRVRRYCAANRTNRFWTLTYAGGGCHDPAVLRRALGEFFRGVRSALGGNAFPYLWVPEWHKTGHGLHAHFVVAQYIKRSVIESVWQQVPGHGFVHVKLIGDLPVGSTAVDEARIAARYIAKYMNKDFEEKRVMGLHRYDLAQGFQPQKVTVPGPSLPEAYRRACELMGGPTSWFSKSDEWENWAGHFGGGDAVGRLTDQGLVDWVTKSCVAQGVPVKVTDVRVVDRVRTLLTGLRGHPNGA